MKMNNSREDYNKLEEIAIEKWLSMKIKLLFLVNNLKDLIMLFKERIMKSEPQVEKSKKHKKTLDYQMLNKANFHNN